MGSEWPTTTLGEVASFVNGDRGSNYPKHSDFTESGVPFVNTGHIEPNGTLTNSGMQFISRGKFEQLRSGFLQKGDLVYCLRGSTIGKIARVDLEEGSIASSLVIIRAKEIIDQSFLFYFLYGPTGQELVGQHDNGSAQPNLSVSAISKFPLPLPPLPEQKAIAHILGTLDDKIELNRRMNATQEGMAQALFKSWFVDFDPVIDNALAAGNPIPDELAPRAEVRKKALASSGEPGRTNSTTQQGSVDHPTLSDPKSLFPAAFQFTDEIGWIPKGWAAGTLGNCLAEKGYVRGPFGSALKRGEMKSSGIPVYEQQHAIYGHRNFRYFIDQEKHEQLERFSTKPNDIIISCSGTVGRISIIRDTDPLGIISQALLILRPNLEMIPLEYLISFLSSPLGYESMTTVSTGSVQVNLAKRAIIESIRIPIPPSSVLNLFSATLGSFRSGAEANKSQIESLTNLRDTLLPKLISGELRAPKVEQEVKEVTA